MFFCLVDFVFCDVEICILYSFLDGAFFGDPLCILYILPPFIINLCCVWSCMRVWMMTVGVITI